MRTAAERKEITPPTCIDDCEEPKPFRSQQVSVIQRTPAVIQPDSPSDDKSEEVHNVQEPEQEEPIDYHIPKKPSDSDDEIKPKSVLPCRRQQSILFVGRKYAKSTNILMAAAGHSRTNNNNNNGQCGGNTQSNSSNSTNRNSAGGQNNYNGNGVNVFNAGYIGTGNGGGDRPNDSSVNGGGYEGGGSPIGSLPPFYESLKGGHLPGYQHPQLCNQYPSSLSSEHHIGMDYDTGQDVMHFSNLFSASDLPKYSMLHNMCATFGITMKEDEDVNLTNYLKDNGSIFSYDDSLMIDAVSGNNVDSLSFPNSLNFSSPNDNSQIIDMPGSPDLFMREVSFYFYLVLYKYSKNVGKLIYTRIPLL